MEMGADMISGILQQMSFRFKVGVTILFFLIGVEYLLVPIIQWRNDMVNHVISLQQSIAHKKAFIGMDRNVESVYKENIAQRDQWRRYFETNLVDPQSLQLKLQKQVEGLTAQLNIKTINVDWLPGTKGDIIQAPVTFRLESMPENFMKLLFAVEQLPYFVAIEGINIMTRSQSEMFIVKLDISAYGLSEALSKK